MRDLEYCKLIPSTIARPADSYWDDDEEEFGALDEILGITGDETAE